MKVRISPAETAQSKPLPKGDTPCGFARQKDFDKPVCTNKR